jgi:preprotein translocase subunit SecG
MANEAVCIETPTEFARVIVANATAVPIGTLMEHDAGTNLASASSADNDFFAGIAWEEKTANDGITELTVALNGVWSIVCTAAAVVNGQTVNLAGANVVNAGVDGDLENGSLVGKCLQSSAGSEAVRVRVGRF